MKNRNRANTRHQRSRIIQQKLYVVRNVWGRDEKESILHPFIAHPGKLAKGKLNCACRMCKYDKHYKIFKSTVASKLELMQQEMDEYWSEE